jgi:hypothetical protein
MARVVSKDQRLLAAKIREDWERIRFEEEAIRSELGLRIKALTSQQADLVPARERHVGFNSCRNCGMKNWFGGPDRDRTGDLMNAIHARSQLRYRPTQGEDEPQL